MRVAILLSAIVLSACGTQQSPVDIPDGTEPRAFTLHCPDDWAECDRQAKIQCGDGGYREVGREQPSPTTWPSDVWDLDTGPKDGIVTIRCN